jgi:transcriptional regulator with XRE-family HTH domain
MARRTDYEKAKRNIVDRIRGCRGSSGRTLTAVAEDAGLTKSYLCDIEKGRRINPSVETILRLADVLEVAPEYLLTGRG